MLTPGDFVGPYRIERELGRGGMAVVYLAYHERLERAVALKILHQNLQGDAGFVARFLYEARAAARLDHPNIVALHDAGQIDGIDYIAIEYVEGESLAEIMQRVRGPLPLDFTLSVIGQVAAALDYAHSRGVVHRDIKPSNILVRHTGHALLADFGIARAASIASLTHTGSVMGTPEYMSPEQAEGKSVDGRSDLYSLAIVAYRMLTGSVPFRGESPQATLYAHVHHPLPDPGAANPELTPAISAILRTATAKKPEQRFPTAGAFAQALRTPAAAAPPPAAPPPPRPDPPARPAGPGIWLYAALGFLLGVALLSIAAWALLRDQEPPPRPPAATTPAGGGLSTLPPLPAAATATATPSPSPTLTATPTETPTPTPTPTATPDLPPRLAYVSNRSGAPQIYTIFADGSGDTQLTFAGRNDRPFWAADGSQLFFASDRSGQLALWAMRPDGSEQTEGFAAPAALNYSLSPDGQYIAYAGAAAGDFDIYLDNSIWAALPGDQIEYVWAPDSSRILFENAEGPQVLYTIARGGQPLQITEESYGSWNPTWAPDSRRLAYASTQDGNAGIYTFDLSGGAVQRLTPMDVWSQAPTWAPSGAAIAHISGEGDGSWGLYLVSADGRGRIHLFGPVFPEAPAAWSSDSRLLAFILHDGDQELALIAGDGSGFRRLTDNSADDWNPVWQPR